MFSLEIFWIIGLIQTTRGSPSFGWLDFWSVGLPLEPSADYESRWHLCFMPSLLTWYVPFFDWKVVLLNSGCVLCIYNKISQLFLYYISNVCTKSLSGAIVVAKFHLLLEIYRLNKYMGFRGPEKGVHINRVWRNMLSIQINGVYRLIQVSVCGVSL